MKIGNDKIQHLIVCLLIALAVSCIAANAFFPLWPQSPGTRLLMAAGAGILAAMVTGVAKELRDMRQPGNHFCKGDLLADAAGAILGSLGALVTLLL